MNEYDACQITALISIWSNAVLIVQLPSMSKYQSFPVGLHAN